MSEWWANLAVAAGILLAGLSLLLAVVGLAAARRMHAGKLALVGVAFAGFCAQGVYLTWLAYSRRADVAAGGAGEFPILTLADLGIVLVLYLAVLKR